MKYRKKPIVIEAVQFNRINLNEVLNFAGKTIVEYGCARTPNAKAYCIIKTLEGEMKATEGDYIIKGVQGEFYPCKPDIFEATYEEVRE